MVCGCLQVKLDPKNTDAWSALGECFWKKGDVPAARNCFQCGVEQVCVCPRLATAFSVGMWGGAGVCVWEGGGVDQLCDMAMQLVFVR